MRTTNRSSPRGSTIIHKVMHVCPEAYDVVFAAVKSYFCRMNNPGKLMAILTNRCPACHEGSLFKKNNPYGSGFMEMEPKCPVCGENFKREPGFYFGAAYVSYALTVALWIAVVVALIVFDAMGLISYAFFENPIVTIVAGISAIILLLPVLFRLSRSIWIHMFVNRSDRS